MEYLESTLDKSVEDIVELEKAVFDHYYGADRIRDRLNGKKHWIYLVQDNGKPIAFKIWYEDSDGQIYSWLGGVHPDYRRRGIASRLMEIQFDMARRQGYSKVKLKTHKGHPEMIALCKKRGFEFKGIHNDHWRNELDAIYFEFEL